MNSPKLLTGILLTVFAGCVFATMDALGKQLMTLLPVLQVVWGRYVVQTILMTLFLSKTTGTRFLKTRRPVLQMLRGLLLLSATLTMYFALSNIPLADATAIMFVSPLVVTILSVLFLQEKIGIHRIAAIIVGFAAVMLIVRPGFSEFDPNHLLPLLASVLNSGYLLLTRQLAGADDTAATQFNTTAVGSVVLSVLVIPLWQTPSLSTAALMVLIGTVGAIGHFSLIRAFAHASASLLSPFLYSQVLFASIVSILWFGDPMGPTTVIGTAVLIASGLYIWWRENRTAHRVAMASRADEVA